jgi:hypothetical protein
MRAQAHNSVPRRADEDEDAPRVAGAELAGKFVHTDGRAVTALETAHAQDPNPAVRKRRAGSHPAAPSANEPLHAHPAVPLDREQGTACHDNRRWRSASSVRGYPRRRHSADDCTEAELIESNRG